MKDLDFKDADVVVLVYSITLTTSFDSIQVMYDRALAVCPDALFYLVGNKVDLDAAGERAVFRDELVEIKKKMKFEHCCETNAFDSGHINNLFENIRRRLD